MFNPDDFEADVGFDLYQLRCATSSIIFRDDSELTGEKEREDLEWAVKQLSARLGMLPAKEEA